MVTGRETIDAYNKVERCINSCITLPQLVNANKLRRLYDRQLYSERNQSYALGTKRLLSDRLRSTYRTLRKGMLLNNRLTKEVFL